MIPNHGKQLIDDARLVIPFYNEYNDLIAVSGRALESGDKTLRYVTIRVDNSENKLIFGMDRIKLSETVRIVEGPIDSLFVKNCLASGDANLSLTASAVSTGKKILIFDNEPRNKEVLKLMHRAIESGHRIVIWPDDIEGKDINEMVRNGLSPKKICDIISSNTFDGLQAQTKFVFWKKI